MPREHALHAAMNVQHGKILLRAREQKLNTISQCSVGWQGMEISEHGITHPQVSRGLLLGDTGSLLARGHKNEKTDEQQHGLKRVVQQHVDGHHHGDALPDRSRPPCGGAVLHEHGEYGAQHPPPVHGKRRNQVEDHHDDIDQGAADGHDQLLRRLARHSLQPRHAANGQQRDVRCANAVASCGQHMAKLMQHHARKHGGDKQGGLHCCGNALSAEKTLAGHKQQQQQKGEMHTNFRASEGEEAEGPFHRGGRS